VAVSVLSLVVVADDVEGVTVVGVRSGSLVVPVDPEAGRDTDGEESDEEDGEEDAEVDEEEDEDSAPPS
jgi:hypothetical protein